MVMPAPYSLDLRKKLVEVAETEKISQRKLAERFKVHINTVKRYIKLAKTTGDLSPKKGEEQGRPSKLNEADYHFIKSLYAQKNTLTLEQLSEEFYKKKKKIVGRSILGRACQKLELNRKKLSQYAKEKDSEAVKKKQKITIKK